MSEPSVKGSVFQSVAGDLKQLIEQGVVDASDLESMLTDKDRGLLDSLVTAVAWVPIGSYCRMLEVLARYEGGNDPVAYYHRRGADAAERLLSGTYASFDADPGSWGEQVAKSMIRIAEMLYNFTTWTVAAQGDGVFEIRAAQAADYPEVARHTAHGFLQAFASKSASEPLLVTSDRPRPDVVTFRITPAD
jgi:hypothetical protein